MNYSEKIQVEKLVELSRRKLECLGMIQEYTEQQTEPIKIKDFERLEELINLKQKQIDTIDQLDDEFNSLFNQLKNSLGVKSLADVNSLDKSIFQELQDSITKIREIILKIQEKEKSNSGLASQVRQELKQKLQNVKNGKKMLSGYTKAGAPPPVFFDKKK